jgi:single-stranded DNA-specific DHH superfamily exonuclease
MLTAKQLKEIREHLEKAQNPVFLYDNDADGLCSFVLLRRFLGRGKGVAVRTHPDIDAGYAKRAHELGADYVFVDYLRR